MTEDRPVWRKSSQSTQGTSEQCVEVARLPWRKSTHSDETGGHCVELAALPYAVAVRDSKAPDAGHLALTPRAFADLLARAKQDSLPR
ncbi:DUF397 domain-containing protein [Actinomadura verrucosospora]|uniref:DUF397 domain-containing protein n=1 Tax=Actinomadura verrucosospora TaxID=46165 RepID=UPI00338BE05C